MTGFNDAVDKFYDMLEVNKVLLTLIDHLQQNTNNQLPSAV